ncbi:ATP-binding protein [Roseomonas sp. KE2513]|uniref:ATP-binding protein n=1 Tax=Roseomonas sp. KE2513 TaxID=2479202 RepID=UPI0018DF0172|nr:ATP-binding protein [Roseomonas sp. KE2513]MBI0534675.1 ATP-binding protein [Roseomonas sp. KE2513]
MSASVTKLRVRDEDFLVASMIERCPRTMMIRELLQNALEATQAVPEGERVVEFSARMVDGVPKLALWNRGIGLTGAELYAMCDIAASIRKESGLDRNFGMGAKVASLPSNQRGMRYRSARDGVVQEVVIGKVDGIYGRLRRLGPDGEMTEVLSVPGSELEAHDASTDWIEVLLLGNEAGQDTVANPYNGQPRSSWRWLVDAICNRFFRFPPSARIVLQAGVAGLRAPRQLVSLADRLQALDHYEQVKTPEGIIIHYAYDPPHPTRANVNASQGTGPESANSIAGLVHRDEIYAVKSGAGWWRDAPSYGIAFAARHISILVELPDDYPVLPEAYREFLRYRDGKQAQIYLLDFAGLVARNQPLWLARILAEAAPTATYTAEVENELHQMLEQLGVPKQRPRSQPSLDQPPAPLQDPNAPRVERPLVERPPVERPLVLESTPALFLLRDPAELADRDLLHRAAGYYPETHQLHVNLTYPAATELAQRLTDLAPADLDPEQVTKTAMMIAERAMVLRIARALVYALAKRNQSRDWRDAHMRVALSPEALTLAADDIRTAWPEAEAAMRQAMTALSSVEAA